MCRRFNGYSYAITITLKGAYAIRSLASNFDKQYQLFKNIISNIIHKYASEYCFYFELHKCGEWLHTHGVINLKKVSYLNKIKSETFLQIEKKQLEKYKSYKTRICMDKISDIMNWYNYISKDENSILEFSNNQYKKIYCYQKLI